MRKNKAVGISLLVAMILSLWSAGAGAVELTGIPFDGGAINTLGQKIGSVFDSTYPNNQPTIVQTAAQPANVQAQPNNASVMIDGKRVGFEAYTIDGYNYFKLRDLAMALNGSEKQFEVTWDGSKNAISLLIGQAYNIAGGELSISGQTGLQKAVMADSKLYIDSQELKLVAYTINNYTYFKLRDVGQAINFGITWDGAANAIKIDTAVSYASK